MHNAAAGDMIGLPGVTKLDGPTLGMAADQQGQIFESLMGKPFSVSPTTRETLAALSNPGSKLKPLLTRLSTTEGEVPGELVKNLRRQLQDRMSAARGTDGLMADDYQTALESLFKDIEGGIGADGVKQFRQVRQQWKNLNILESMPELRATGNVTPRQASNALASERGYGKTYVRARTTGDPATDRFMELTRNLAQFKPIPDSGTATRMALPTVGAAIAGGQGDDPMGALGGAAMGATGGYLIPLALGRALTLAP
jgi:hypothetical protein